MEGQLHTTGLVIHHNSNSHAHSPDLQQYQEVSNSQPAEHTLFAASQELGESSLCCCVELC